MPSTHATKLERWLGVDHTERVSRAMRNWYGPPIPVAGVPGNVWAHKGGDFQGSLHAGQFASGLDYLESAQRRWRRAFKRLSRSTYLNTGFSSLPDLISEANAGKLWTFPFQKSGTTGTIGYALSLWRVGALPPAGAAPAAAPGGTAFDVTSVGSFAQPNPASGDTLHFLAGYPAASISGQTLLLYDLLFGVAKTMNSTSTEAVTGVPTRYQSTTTTDPDYIGGNFLAIHVGGTNLAATAHNWTVCTYTDQAAAASTLPSVAGNSAAIADRIDHPIYQWFCPLEAGDVGIQTLTQMQCDAAVATGVIWFMIGHPIAWMPIPLLNMICITDGIQSAFQPTRIFDNACLALMEVEKPLASNTNYSGHFQAVAG